MVTTMHEKLIKQLRSDKRCSGCPYDTDCNEFDSCLMDLLAADALEDMNRRIAKLEKQKSDMVYVIPTDTDKPLKLVYEDDVTVIENDDASITVQKALSRLETKRFLEYIFGTTNIGVYGFSNIKEDLYYCPTCQRILDLTEIDSCMNTPNEIIDYCLKCQNEVVNLKDNA